eukprot:31198-Pelagococcus_subviridis.AAC.16
MIHEREDRRPRLVHARDDGASLPHREVFQCRHHVQSLERVETARGLVHENELRVVQEVHPYRDALAFAAGYPSDHLVPDHRVRRGDEAEVRDDGRHRVLDLLRGRVRWQPELRGERERLADGGQREQRVFLLDVRGDARHLRRRRHLLAVRVDRPAHARARALRDAERERVQQRRLPASGRAHEREQRAAEDVAAEAVEDDLRLDRGVLRLGLFGHRVRHVAPLKRDAVLGDDRADVPVRRHLLRVRVLVRPQRDGHRGRRFLAARAAEHVARD